MAKYRPGDRVIVPWGLDHARGTVVRVFGPAAEPFVMVRLDLRGTDEGVADAEVGFKASDVKPAAAKATH
jgi:rRNA processing protein Gar1